MGEPSVSILKNLTSPPHLVDLQLEDNLFFIPVVILFHSDFKSNETLEEPTLIKENLS